MLDTTILTDEQAAAIWSGETASILNLDQNNNTNDSTANIGDKGDEENKDLNLDGIFSEENEPDDKSSQATDDKNIKNNDDPFVKSVNDLISEGVLLGYNDDKPISSVEEAKQLIQENLKYKENSSFDSLWENKKKSYSPQIQAIIQYADQGGKDISPLLENFSKIEQEQELSLDNDSDCETIVRKVLTIKGFDEDEVNDQVETLKDLDKLKAKAEKFKPELDKIREQEINKVIETQAELNRQAKEASRIYLETIENTLKKETVGTLKLENEDKARIFDALSEPKHKSISGYNVNGFIKKLEELQFGATADYEHFLNIVQFAVDKENFLEKIKSNATTDVTVNTVKQLKTAKDTKPNTVENQMSFSNKKTIESTKLKNPFK